MNNNLDSFKNNEAFKTLIMTLLITKKRDNATELMVEDISKKENIYTTRDDEHCEMWIYKEGIYVPQAKTYIQEYVRNLLGEVYTTNLCNLIIDKVKADTYIEMNEFFKEEPPHLVAVKNGILNLKNRELTKFSPRYKFFNKMPVKYDATKDCPNIKKFFKSLFKDEKEILVIQEVFGYLPYRSYFLEKSIMNLGSGRNGKGKTLDLMKRFIGADNCVEIPLEALEGDIFAQSELFKKQANLCGDLSKTALKNTGTFKKLTGRDLITSARKFKERISFENYAKMVFNANELPVTKDVTTGFFSRWIILDFPFTFLPEEEIKQLSEEKKKNVKIRDTDIIDKIVTPNEMSGLLNWALDGLKRLLENKCFSYSPSTNEVERKWLRKSNAFHAFCMDCLEEAWDGAISKDQLRMAYISYFRKHKLKNINEKVIKETLMENYGCSEERLSYNGSQGRYWVGIKFVENLINSHDSQNSHSFYTYREKTKSSLRVKNHNYLDYGDYSKDERKQLIHSKCIKCGDSPSHFYDKQGNPLCETCYGSINKQEEIIN